MNNTNAKSCIITKTIIIFFVAVIFSGCFFDTECCDEVGSWEIDTGLYLEGYRTFCAGVYGEVIDYYITDSLTFREKVGLCDEHECFYVKSNGDIMEAYNTEISYHDEIVEQKTISKEQLLQYHHTDKNSINTVPMFGINSLKCNDNYYHFYTDEIKKGYYVSKVQFKCPNNYFLNAAFFTDSLNFSVLIGFYDVGSSEIHYKVKQKGKNNFIFSNMTTITEIDTVKHVSFPLAKLREGKLIDVCESRK